MLPNSSWKEETRVMGPGDLLCVYSDGLTEAVNSADEEYGLDRLSREIESRRDHPAKTLCGEILDSVEQFASGMPQYDDQTLMLLRRTETTG
jgi:sigma-B regulation protein RsbU (phosphoserine phosphatase)